MDMCSGAPERPNLVVDRMHPGRQVARGQGHPLRSGRE
jgi:hypothetical protein